MVKQIRAPKTSSAARVFLKNLSELDSPEKRWMLLRDEGNEVLVKEILDRHLFERRKELMLDLANMHNSGFSRFRRIWGKRFLQRPSPSEREILQLRDELRRIWQPTSASIAEKNKVLEEWLEWRPSRPPGLFSRIGFDPKAHKWQPVLQTGSLIPAFASIHGQVIQGVLEQCKHLAVCNNPECSAPFFLAKRNDQKYCENDECIHYAQRKYALEWWNREGKQLRREK